jgi:hypothetical protein
MITPQNRKKATNSSSVWLPVAWQIQHVRRWVRKWCLKCGFRQIFSLPTGQPYCIAPPELSGLYSVMCVQYSSSAKRSKLWTYELGYKGMTEFATAEGCSPTGIRKRLKSVYGMKAIDVSSVRPWAHRFKSRWGPSAADWLLKLRQSKVKADALLRGDLHITTRELCTTTGKGEPAVMVIIIREPTYKKFAQNGCRKRSLSNTNSPKDICAELHQCSEKEGDTLCQV